MNDDIEHLSLPTRHWFTSIDERYRLSNDRRRTLLVAAEAFDRSQMCRRQVAADGLMVTDRYGQQKVNPAADAEKSAKSLYLASMKALALDGLGEPVAEGPASKYLA